VRRTLATVGVLGGAFLVLGTTAATAHPPAAGSPLPSWPGPYGLGGKISLRPPGAWQPATGPVAWRALVAPLRALGLPRFGLDINISGGDAANQATIATNPTPPRYFVASATAPGGGSGHYQPGPLSFSGVRHPAAGAIPRANRPDYPQSVHAAHRLYPERALNAAPTRPCTTNLSL
jgi:hypothetical protein